MTLPKSTSTSISAQKLKSKALSSATANFKSKKKKVKISCLPKSPVVLLHEICQKRDVPLRYDQIGYAGEAHAPTYTFQVTADDGVDTPSGTGSGGSKRIAKFCAAYALLKRITGLSHFVGENVGFSMSMMIKPQVVVKILLEEEKRASRISKERLVQLAQECDSKLEQLSATEQVNDNNNTSTGTVDDNLANNLTKTDSNVRSDTKLSDRVLEKSCYLSLKLYF